MILPLTISQMKLVADALLAYPRDERHEGAVEVVFSIHKEATRDDVVDTVEGVSRDMKAAPLTHCIPYDTERKRIVRAYCGIFVRQSEHSLDPTCPRCAELQAQFDRAVI